MFYMRETGGSMRNPLFDIQTLTGRPVKVGDVQVYVRSQVLQARLPSGNGGLIWNRPLSVMIRTPNSQEQILSVPDLTRTAVLTLLVLSLVSTFLLMRFRRTNDES
jgi:hypothetical protein